MAPQLWKGEKMAWATFEDVVSRWVGAGAPTDTDLVEALIADAEQVILATYPAIQDRIDSNTLPEARVTFVVTSMVSRVLRNPEGLTYWQQQTGPFGQARNFGTDFSGIYLTDNEIKLLAPVTRGKAFEVDAGWTAGSRIDDVVWLEVD